MRKQGVIFICDRCEEEEHVVTEELARSLNPLSYGRDSKLPPGWKAVWGKDLCPVCAEMFEKFIKGDNEYGRE